ncbi:preprotein translocase subunit YajC [Clostridium acetireducens DSM 10703]|jgi:preprotein translocase subunit YajC|uniref:Preprotein translocase subunit YajC n=1 Tax=Clostridium acetireducens DSM 10703 TaxID=1121290 RepID=A0A1E8EWX3_9CLOT|nr:preprotein translocase subunit YajC [Clostridium acetireducens]OFI05252.1 preprotein translocase subunit YajC [Clostridium acetireducens DSM 10703]
MGQSAFTAFIPLIFFIAFFYLVIYMPEKNRKKKYDIMIKGLKANDEILTRGGIIGKIVNIEKDYVIIQSGPDSVRFKLEKNGILQVFNKTIEEPKKGLFSKEKKEEKQNKEYKEVKEEK